MNASTSSQSQAGWMMVIRGIAAIVFGLGALLLPGITLLVLIAFYGAYAIVDGIIAFVAAAQAAERQIRWWPFLLKGILGVGAGIVAFIWPGLTAIVLVFLIAAWAITTGALEIVVGARLREWLLLGAGLLSVVVGVILAVFPGAGAVSLVWLIGSYALIFGALLLVHAFTQRSTAPA